MAVQKQKKTSAPGQAEDCVTLKSAKLPRGKGKRKRIGDEETAVLTAWGRYTSAESKVRI